jgi:hypothetical protein
MSNYFDNAEGVDAWFQKRRAKFTASTNYKLGDGKMHTTYVEEKVIELTTQIWERPELEEVKSLLHGKLYEYPAYERYIHETKNYSMTYFGTENPVFIEWDKSKEESGGTPDIANLTKDNKIDYGTELKCPKSPAYHFRRLNWTSQWDIKEQYLSCYCQIQNLIMITGAFGFDFVSYDERQLAKSKQIKIIEVKPDQKFINNLEIKIELAVKEKYKLLSKYMGVELKNKTEYLNFLKQ